VRQTVHLVAACCDGKSIPVPLRHRLRGVRLSSFEERIEEWWTRLTAAEETVPARELYQGQYWATVLRSSEAAAAGGHRLKLWVASAGYGLVDADWHLAPYSATFAAGLADSVSKCGSVDATRRWWRALAGQRVPGARGPRTVARLAAEHPRDVVMVLGSPAYVEALSHDLARARERLNRPEQLVLVTSRDPTDPILAANTVPSRASLQQKLAGALVSLHAQVANKILRESPHHGLDARDLRARYQALAASLPPVEKASGKRMTDAEVLQFIARLRRKERGITKSRAHRRLRDAAFACEQKRFNSLFAKEA
jgi:hypothetical protein